MSWPEATSKRLSETAKVQESPTSGSLTVTLPTMAAGAFSATLELLRLMAVGASLVLATVRMKLSVTLALEPSLAVTVMLRAPTSALSGVPEKVRVKALKLSQAGRGLPLSSLAL